MRTPLRADRDRPAAPVLCPGDRVVADVRLSLLGVRLPFSVLGDDSAGEPPAAGRIRLPASAEEIATAAAAGELIIGDYESTPVGTLTELSVAPAAGWIEGRLLPAAPAEGRIEGRLPVDPAAGLVDGRLKSVAPDAAALPVRTGDSRVVIVPARPLTQPDLEQLGDAEPDLEPGVEHLRGAGSGDVVLVLPVGGVSPDGVPAAVLRQCLEQAAPEDFTLLPLPVCWRGTSVDEALARAVATALDGTQLRRPRSAAESRVAQAIGLPGAFASGATDLKTGAEVRAARPHVQPGAAEAGDLAWAETLEYLHGASGEPAVSSDPLLAKALPVLTRWRPPRQQRGLVVFFTGLSGSGKSTLAKALADHLTSQVDRSVTLLDGDIVRRMLSSGLGFDRAGRDLNVRRIGFVAAEVARHGGIAVCAPIAPYAESRAAVRAMVEAVGDLVLVHVATPLAECERRDVKGLYRKARAGVVTQFTGISDPYDEPLDAEVRVDTAETSLPESLAAITDYLTKGGWLPVEKSHQSGG